MSCRKTWAFIGAEDGARTHDLLFTRQLLYQLSYFSIAALAPV